LWWPKLQAELQSLPAAQQSVKHGRPEREILEEILELVRGQVRSGASSVDILELLDSNSEGSLKPAGEFMPGTHVRHAKFGRGLVLRREGRGDQLRLTVSFPGYGQKKLIQKYAGLTDG
jgi:hypothetical protein